MVRITIELLPRGSEAHKRHLGTMEIANDRTGGSGPLGSYDVRLSKRGRPNVLWRTGKVERFPRLALGAYDLLFRALAATIGSRNPHAMVAPPTHDERETF